MNRRTILAVMAVTALFIVMSASFVGIPWPPESHYIPITGNGTSNATNTLTSQLFESYPVAVILIGIILAAAMVGGVYLAKMEGGKIGP